MDDMARIERRCSRIARSLDDPVGDETTLLRAARALQSVHADLRHATWQQARAEGQAHVRARAESSLRIIEQDLRLVLLSYSSLHKRQLHTHLVHALNQSIQALSELESVRVRSHLPVH